VSGVGDRDDSDDDRLEEEQQQAPTTQEARSAGDDRRLPQCCASQQGTDREDEPEDGSLRADRVDGAEQQPDDRPEGCEQEHRCDR